MEVHSNLYNDNLFPLLHLLNSQWKIMDDSGPVLVISIVIFRLSNRNRDHIMVIAEIFGKICIFTREELNIYFHWLDCWSFPMQEHHPQLWSVPITQVWISDANDTFSKVKESYRNFLWLFPFIRNKVYIKEPMKHFLR